MRKTSDKSLYEGKTAQLPRSGIGDNVTTFVMILALLHPLLWLFIISNNFLIIILLLFLLFKSFLSNAFL